MTAHGGLFTAPRLPTAFCGSPVPGAAEFQPSACRSRPLPAPRSPSFRAASGLQHSVQCPDHPRVSPTSTPLHLLTPLIFAGHPTGHHSPLCSSLIPSRKPRCPLFSALSFVHLASLLWPGNSPKEVSLHSLTHSLTHPSPHISLGSLNWALPGHRNGLD